MNEMGGVPRESALHVAVQCKTQRWRLEGSRYGVICPAFVGYALCLSKVVCTTLVADCQIKQGSTNALPLGLYQQKVIGCQLSNSFVSEGFARCICSRHNKVKVVQTLLDLWSQVNAPVGRGILKQQGGPYRGPVCFSSYQPRHGPLNQPFYSFNF